MAGLGCLTREIGEPGRLVLIMASGTLVTYEAADEAGATPASGPETCAVSTGRTRIQKGAQYVVGADVQMPRRGHHEHKQRGM
jgi:hypothetical protein